MSKFQKRKLKIAIFHCGFIYSGGGERMVLEEAMGLEKKGYTVSVFAPTLDGKICYPELLKKVKVQTFLPSVIDWLPLRNAFRMMISSLLAPFFAYRFRDIDIFIGANQPGIWIAFCVSSVLNKPYVSYLNQPNRIVYPRPVDVEFGWHSTVKDYEFLFKLFSYIRPVLAFFDKISIRKSKTLFVNGSYIGGVIENVYAKDTKIALGASHCASLNKIPNNVSLLYKGNVKINGFSIPRPYALITNRHDPQKRFDFAIKAFKKVLKYYPDASLVISGPFTKHTENLKKLVKDLKLEERVYFLGLVPEKMLETLYKNALVYCYPSPEEDYGLGILEAGGWGVPSVAWNNAGPTVTVADGVSGFLAEPFDVKDYADKILIFFRKPSIRDKMGKAAWKRTKNIFSWENHVDVIEQEIIKLI